MEDQIGKPHIIWKCECEDCRDFRQNAEATQTTVFELCKRVKELEEYVSNAKRLEKYNHLIWG